ncbi:MAG: PfkB family carbohydrate kinase [Arachnia sp.]
MTTSAPPRVLRTVTLNTGYDDYYTVSGLDWGGVGTMHGWRSVCSGKGVSCARTAVALGLPTVAYALVGAEDEAEYAARLAAEGIDHRLVTVRGRTRHNLTLVDGTGARVAAHFVGAGYALDGPADVAPLVATVLADVRPGDVVTLNGSTPTGLPATTWADLARALLSRGAQVVVDAQKDALVAALAVPGVLAFKPNDDEILALPAVAAAEPAGRIRAALDTLAATGTRLPLVSLGGDGVALLADGRELRGSCPVAQPVQSVMAGDAFVAGLAWGALSSDDPLAWARHGLAAAAAHVAGLAGAALRERALANLAEVRIGPRTDTTAPTTM